MNRFLIFLTMSALLSVSVWSQETKRNDFKEIPPILEPPKTFFDSGDPAGAQLPSSSFNPVEGAAKEDKTSKYEQRIARLEKQIAELRVSMNKLLTIQRQQSSSSYNRIPGTQGYRPVEQPAPQQTPSSWQRFQFNGADFYIVPADSISPGDFRANTTIKRPLQFQPYERR